MKIKFRLHRHLVTVLFYFLLSIWSNSIAAQDMKCDYTIPSGSSLSALVSNVTIPPDIINGATICVEGVFLIDESYAFINCTFIMSSGASFLCLGFDAQLSRLTIFGSTFQGDKGAYWNGIFLNSGSDLVYYSNPGMYNVSFGIQANSGSSITYCANNSIYTQYSGITMKEGSSLIWPMAGNRIIGENGAITGIEIDKLPYASIGSNTIFFSGPNVIEDFQFGINANNVGSLDIRNNQIKNFNSGLLFHKNVFSNIYSNFLENGRIGISLTECNIISVSSNPIADVYHGIAMTGSGHGGTGLNTEFEINSNDIEYENSGINLYGLRVCPEDQMSSINYNGIEQLSGFTSGAGVSLLNIDVARSPCSFVSNGRFGAIMEVKENDIKLDYSFGIKAENAVKIKYEKNSISEKTVDASSDWVGMNLQNCKSNQLIKNGISGSQEPKLTSFGLNVVNSPDCFYECNMFNNTGVGANFWFDCRADESYQRNIHTANAFIGLSVLSNTVLGTQTNQFNRWLQDIDGATEALNAGSYTDDLFIMKDQYIASGAWPDPHIPLNWFQTDASLPPDDNLICPGNVPDPPNEPCYITSTEYKIADGSILEAIDQTPGLWWTLKKGLLIKLRENPELMNCEDVLAEFYNTENISALGVLLDFEDELSVVASSTFEQRNRADEIESLLELGILALKSMEDEVVDINMALNEEVVSERRIILDEIEELRVEFISLEHEIFEIQQLEYEALFEELETIYFENPWEENEYIVHRIWLESIVLNDGDLSSEDLNELLTIAEQCPTLGGDAVYKARMFYEYYSGEFLQPLKETCESFDIIPHSKKKNLVSNDSKLSNVLIEPNPVDQNVTIHFASSLVETQITIADFSGKVIYSNIIEPNATKTKIDVSQFQNGIYSVRALNRDEVLFTKSIIIQH